MKAKVTIRAPYAQTLIQDNRFLEDFKVTLNTGTDVLVTTTDKVIANSEISFRTTILAELKKYSVSLLSIPVGEIDTAFTTEPPFVPSSIRYISAYLEEREIASITND
jgi:hypothetical protein